MEPLTAAIIGGGAYYVLDHFRSPILEPSQVRELTRHWLAAVCAHNPAAVAALYASDGILVGTVAQRIKQGPREIKTYFNTFLSNEGICGNITSSITQEYPGVVIDTGTYTFEWTENGKRIQVPARYTFVWRKTPKGWKIANHHSSALPE